MRWEKRTDRLEIPRQLRIGAGLGKAIRKLAERDRRSIQQQMIVLLINGIKLYSIETYKELVGGDCQALSDSGE
jgi:hypothetical protein